MQLQTCEGRAGLNFVAPLWRPAWDLYPTNETSADWQKLSRLLSFLPFSGWASENGELKTPRLDVWTNKKRDYYRYETFQVRWVYLLELSGQVNSKGWYYEVSSSYMEWFPDVASTLGYLHQLRDCEEGLQAILLRWTFDKKPFLKAMDVTFSKPDFANPF